MKLYQSVCNMSDNAKTITAGFDGLDIGCLNKIRLKDFIRGFQTASIIGIRTTAC